MRTRLAFILLVSVVVVLSFTPLFLISMEHHHGSARTQDCVLMIGEKLCMMSLFEHVTVWEGAFVAVLSELLTPLILVLLAAFCLLCTLHQKPRRSLSFFFWHVSHEAAYLFHLLLRSRITPRAP